MPTIDDYELPSSLVAVLEEYIKELPGELVLSFAKSCPEKVSGIRLIKGNVEHLRKRMLATMLGKDQKLPVELVQLLSCNNVNQYLVSELPLESLKTFHDDFMLLWNEEQYLINLLLDDREEVREFAIEWLEEAEDDELELESGDEEEQIDEEIAQKLKDLRKSLEETRREAAAEKKRNKGFQKKMDKLQQDLDSYIKRWSKEKEKAAAEYKMVIQLQKELDSLRDRMQEKISDGIREKLQSYIHSWLSRPSAIETLAAEDNSPLLDRVTKALEKQACTDKHSGNVNVLKERLIALEQAKENVDQARRDALQPLQELAPLSRELAEEIKKRRELIGIRDKQDSTLASCQARINESGSPDELGRISVLLQELHEMDFLSKRDFHILRKQVRHVRDRLIVGRDNLEERIDFATHYKEMCMAQEHDSLNIIVDGHNVILGPDNYYLFNGDNEGILENEKRKILTAMNKQIFEDKTDITVTVFFDSPVSSVNIIAPNIKEIYSGGGQEDQRADNAIINHLQEARDQSQSGHYVVVSNDKELVSSALKLGAGSMSVFDYGVMLRRI